VSGERESEENAVEGRVIQARSVNHRPSRPPPQLPAPDPAVRRIRDELAAIKAISRAVSEAHALEDTLETIARTAASLADAVAAAIILRRDESATGLSVAGSHGLSDRYASELNETCPIEMGKGPSGLAAATRKPVTVADVLDDPSFGPWRGLALREHYRAMVSVPLQLGSGRRVIGVLNAYREAPGEWSGEDVDLLLTLADHAAIAIQTAQLLDESRRQVRGLSLVVRSLRAQGHEHSNLIHAIYGLLSIGEVDEALELISNADGRYQKAYPALAKKITNPVVSGFLIAETVIAGNGGIELAVQRNSRLRTLPSGLTDLDAITILGNLVENATDAVADLPRRRRRISIRVSDRGGELLVRVRDRGPGIPRERARQIFRSGYSTKSKHVGLGLALVQSIVARAGGRIEVEEPRGEGVAITVRIPF
jgi:signal transduction histidine kinase